MKDFVGRELEVNDYVACIVPGYRSLKLARIYGFTEQKVQLVWVEEAKKRRFDTRKYDFLQSPGQLSKVDGPDLTLYLLSK